MWWVWPLPFTHVVGVAGRCVALPFTHVVGVAGRCVALPFTHAFCHMFTSTQQLSAVIHSFSAQTLQDFNMILRQLLNNNGKTDSMKYSYV